MLQVEALRRQHRAICALIEGLRTTAIDTPQGRTLLQLARTAVLNHLNEEDLEFYPRLARVASETALADVFAAEMRAISEAAVRFFDAYVEIVDPEAFARDFGAFRTMLLQRIEREERQLFPALLAASAPANAECAPSTGPRVPASPQP